MRLNFAGVAEEDIREGIRRIGKVVREQVGLFGTLTGASRRRGGGRSAEARARGDRSDGHRRWQLARHVLELPRRRGSSRGRG